MSACNVSTQRNVAVKTKYSKAQQKMSLRYNTKKPLRTVEDKAASEWKALNEKYCLKEWTMIENRTSGNCLWPDSANVRYWRESNPALEYRVGPNLRCLKKVQDCILPNNKKEDKQRLSDELCVVSCAFDNT